jgi:hypothetical protein
MLLTVKNKTDGRIAIEALGQSLNVGETKECFLSKRASLNIWSGNSELGEMLLAGEIELTVVDDETKKVLNDFTALL